MGAVEKGNGMKKQKFLELHIDQSADIHRHPPLADKNVGLFVGLLKISFFLNK
jgi:hypothetical protein